MHILVNAAFAQASAKLGLAAEARLRAAFKKVYGDEVGDRVVSRALEGMALSIASDATSAVKSD